MGLVVTAPCGSFCIACLRPLTRRYASQRVRNNYGSKCT
ncbi:hypothetical protein RAL09_004280 [Vibrio vulnificus]|nr:hypothetical protein [Vibrio vulnificus]EJB0234365.1 hypothetical protein [Vibrio vulnificus]EKJ5338250.1 hypothetical protein [Vibrio vulnificus]ELG5191557.1 hypothetical protein [Vibrio vulnificus]